MQLGVPFDRLWLDAAFKLRIARVSRKRGHGASNAAVAAGRAEAPANAIDGRRIYAAGDFETVLEAFLGLTQVKAPNTPKVCHVPIGTEADSGQSRSFASDLFGRRC